MSQQQQQQQLNQLKILRIGVISSGKIIEERLIRKRDPVSIGQSTNNSLVIPLAELPQTFPLFRLKNKQYVLSFTDQMSGRVTVNNNNLDFDALKSQGLVKKEGNVYVLPMNDDSRGKVVFGNVTILFQFVAPPPEPAKPQIPAIAKGYFLKSIDKLYAGLLAMSTVIHFIVVSYLMSQPVRTTRELEDIPDRFVKIMAPKLEIKPQPKKADDRPSNTPSEAPKEEKPAEAPKEEASDAPPASAREKERQENIKAVEKSAVIMVLKKLTCKGAGCNSNSAASRLLAEDNSGGSFESAISKVKAGEYADTVMGGRVKAVEKYGELTTGARVVQAGGSKVAGTGGAGGKELAGAGGPRVVGGVSMQAPKTIGGGMDHNKISSKVTSKMGALKACYERKLRANPTLKGKVVVFFVVGADGRVNTARVAESSLPDRDVGDCIVDVIKTIYFGRNEKGENVTVTYPFSFSPGG
ncbi:MAG: hypothetical protein GMKNLPBB_01670 [Myxococcota bacterium]|nr:hypothetical protein [Myxococcota bacterium]